MKNFKFSLILTCVLFSCNNYGEGDATDAPGKTVHFAEDEVAEPEITAEVSEPELKREYTEDWTLNSVSLCDLNTEEETSWYSKRKSLGRRFLNQFICGNHNMDAYFKSVPSMGLIHLRMLKSSQAPESPLAKISWPEFKGKGKNDYRIDYLISIKNLEKAKSEYNNMGDAEIRYSGSQSIMDKYESVFIVKPEVPKNSNGRDVKFTGEVFKNQISAMHYYKSPKYFSQWMFGIDQETREKPFFVSYNDEGDEMTLVSYLEDTGNKCTHRFEYVFKNQAVCDEKLIFKK